MSTSNLIAFLRTLAGQSDLLEVLATKGKYGIIAAAADLDLPFTESELDTEIWDLERRLAARRGEAFDAEFGLWRTMWGQFYLEYIVNDLLTSLEEANLIPKAINS